MVTYWIANKSETGVKNILQTRLIIKLSTVPLYEFINLI